MAVARARNLAFLSLKSLLLFSRVLVSISEVMDSSNLCITVIEQLKAKFKDRGLTICEPFDVCHDSTAQ